MDLLPPLDSPRWTSDGSHIDVTYLADLASLHQGTTNGLMTYLIEQEILAEVVGEAEPGSRKGLPPLSDTFLLRFYVFVSADMKRAVRQELFIRYGTFDEREAET